MKSGGGTLLTLAGFFALMSLFAIGGANSAVPEIHRFAVNVQNWLSDRQFSESFALAQLTPGRAARLRCWPFSSAPPPIVSEARAGISRSAVA
jgi:hypothetical protein